MGVIFDGQSLNLAPTGVTRMPDVAMAGLGIQHHVTAVSGQSWSTLQGTQTARLTSFVPRFDRTILVMTGGTSDIWSGGDNDTAAVAFANMETYAASARALGVDSIVATTVTPASIFDGDDETQRLALNSLILGSSAWESVVDLASEPELSNPANTTYYSDGLHWTAAGAAVAGAAIQPAVQAVI